jgi:hypothetical protein
MGFAGSAAPFAAVATLILTSVDASTLAGGGEGAGASVVLDDRRAELHCSFPHPLFVSFVATVVEAARRKARGFGEEDALECSAVISHPVPSSGDGMDAVRARDERGVGDGDGDGDGGDGGRGRLLLRGLDPGATCSPPPSSTFPGPAIARLLRAGTSVP